MSSAFELHRGTFPPLLMCVCVCICSGVLKAGSGDSSGLKTRHQVQHFIMKAEFWGGWWGLSSPAQTILLLGEKYMVGEKSLCNQTQTITKGQTKRKSLSSTGELLSQEQGRSWFQPVYISVCFYSCRPQLHYLSNTHQFLLSSISAGTEIVDRKSIQQERMCSYHSERQRPP